MKGLILISTVAFSLASFAASASEAPSESVCSLTHLKLVADKEGLDPAGALAKECIGKGYTAAKAFFAEGYDAGKEGAVSGYDKAKELAKDGYEDVKEGSKDAYDKAKDGVVEGAGAAWNGLKEAGSSVKESLFGYKKKLLERAPEKPPRSVKCPRFFSAGRRRIHSLCFSLGRQADWA